MSKYFEYFPDIKYGDHIVKDVTRRVRFHDTVANNPLVFLPYTVEEGERAEELSYYYYGSVDYVWTIYLANNIIDPYRDWPMSHRELENYISNKYVYECAIDNFDNSIFNLPKEMFLIIMYLEYLNIDTSLLFGFKPQFVKFIKYINENKSDLTNTVHRFIQYITDNSILVNKDSLMNNTHREISQGVDAILGETSDELKKVIVSYYNKKTLNARFDASNWTRSTLTDGNLLHYVNIEDENLRVSKDTYALSELNSNFIRGEWKAVRYYDYEFDLNESNRQVFLIDKGYIEQTSSELKEMMNGR